MIQKPQQLSIGAERALRELKVVGRARTSDNLARLAFIELKAYGLAEDPVEDVWQLSSHARRAPE